jgi:two-component system response regulator FlrC
MEDTQRILVIEDDPILRDLLAEWLLAAGYRVGVAAEGCSGIEAARVHRPALVVTDMRMPGTGGADVIAELARTYPGIPVIAISAHFRSGHGVTPTEARSLGATRTLAKPFKRAEMVGAVQDLIGPPAP